MKALLDAGSLPRGPAPKREETGLLPTSASERAGPPLPVGFGPLGRCGVDASASFRPEGLSVARGAGDTTGPARTEGPYRAAIEPLAAKTFFLGPEPIPGRT